jgi:hypothetical protein
VTAKRRKKYKNLNVELEISSGNKTKIRKNFNFYEIVKDLSGEKNIDKSLISA